MLELAESYILCFIENTLCNILFSCFFIPRNKKSYFNFLIIAAYSFLSTFLALSHIEEALLKLSLSILLFSILFFILYKAKPVNVLIAATAYVALCTCVEMPFYVFFPYVISEERLDIISENYFMLTIFGLAVKLFDFIIILIINRLYGKKGYLKFLNLKDWGTYFCLPLFSMLILISMVFYDISYFSIIIAIVLLFFNIFLFSNLQTNGLYNKKLLDIIALEEHSKAQLRAFDDIENMYEDQRHQIHEFKNQINFINGLVNKNDMDTLRNYVDEIKSNIDFESNSIETGNSVINILINQAIKKASHKNISIMPDIVITDKINIEDNDLVIILSNLLNNAYEHCETLTHSNKLITFKLENTSNHLLIVCVNPIESQIVVEDNLITTTKGDILKHGYGLKNILKTVQKYNGDVSITTDENKFKYVILIPW